MTVLNVIRPRLAALEHAPTPADVATALRAEGLVVSDASVLDAVAELRRESTGAGVLEALLEVDGVTDVLVNGPKQVFIDRGRGLEPTDVYFADDSEVRSLAVRLAASVGRRLDDAQPWVDARLADGTRFHAVLSPLSDPGTCLSLRVPSRRRLSLDDLVRYRALSEPAADMLRKVVNEKLAFLISGGTGTGKTTLLAAMLAEVTPHDRILIVEDSRELEPCHPHVIRLEGRQANAEGSGAVPLSLLVKQSLRMRPDRVVVGEVRGAEVVDLLAALNTGHEGGCGTVHANSAADVPARLEALAALAGMPRDALHSQAISALQAILHVKRTPQGRKVAGIHVLERDQEGWLAAINAVTFTSDGVMPGQGWDRLEKMLG
ncbi:MAG: TadA family conjugal transfer-associated ATPase [Propionibacteriaceae bacterium]